MLSTCYRQSHYSALNKISARLTEAREFITSFDVTLTVAQNARNAFNNRWYGNSSERKCTELTGHFKDRFAKNSGLFCLLKKFLQYTAFEQFAWINHFFMLLDDPYYRWATTDFLYNRLQQGLLEIPRSRFDQELKKQLPESVGIGSVTRYGRNLLTAIRDNGLLEGKVKKQINSSFISSRTLSFMIYSLSDLGVSAYEFDSSPLYRSLLKPPEYLSSLFISGARFGHWEFTGDYNSVTFTLRHPDLKTWIEECV